MKIIVSTYNQLVTHHIQRAMILSFIAYILLTEVLFWVLPWSLFLSAVVCSIAIVAFALSGLSFALCLPWIDEKIPINLLEGRWQ